MALRVIFFVFFVPGKEYCCMEMLMSAIFVSFRMILCVEMYSFY
jgi:hypothetical protein